MVSFFVGIFALASVMLSKNNNVIFKRAIMYYGLFFVFDVETSDLSDRKVAFKFDRNSVGIG